MSDPASTRWSELWQRLGRDPAPLFADLARRYAEPQRAYHTMAHVLDCLAELEPARHLAQGVDAVELAIWYHDAVYDPHAHDNEEQSAELARQAMVATAMAEAFQRKVAALILATKHHDPSADGDAPLMVDIDLSILGQTAARFDEYEAQIRREYSWVSEEAFRQGRAAILERFLARGRLYNTDYFRGKYEKRARENLLRSLNQLSRGRPA